MIMSHLIIELGYHKIWSVLREAFIQNIKQAQLGNSIMASP
ncbi:hypothetical protein EC50959_2349 [Escherichia coli 5.0959]|nr:hypothetical protein EC50959_2349 [Escherichia coli 5.0959]